MTLSGIAAARAMNAASQRARGLTSPATVGLATRAERASRPLS